MAKKRLNLLPDFLDLLRSFIAADVRFLVVDAHAVAVHGQIRATKDLDVWIDATPSNGPKVYEALRRFGAPLFDLAVEDLSRPGIFFQIGIAPFRIDILTHIEGVIFDEAWPRRIESICEDVTFPVLGREDLIRNKRAVGRPSDLGDVEALEAIDRAKKR